MVNFVYLLSASDHISVACSHSKAMSNLTSIKFDSTFKPNDNIYYLYDETLTYMGSTSLSLTIEEIDFKLKVRETYNSSLRFDK